MSEPIVIEDYDPRWTQQFELLRSRIASALGRLAAAIEHVGSTAVPGLAAKPIIDLDVLLQSASELSEAISRLASLGYQHQGDLGVPCREAFRSPVNAFPHHLYVHRSESREFLRHIAFRNYLRANGEDARAYERLKRSLAEQFRNDREAYTRGKTEFVAALLRRAEATEHSPFASRINS